MSKEMAKKMHELENGVVVCQVTDSPRGLGAA